MKLNEYQEKAREFAVFKYPDYAFANLVAEAGEVMDKLAKYGRKNEVTINAAINQAKNVFDFDPKGKPKEMIAAHNKIDLFNDLVKELGDVLWQLSACCDAIGVDLDYIADENLTKLGQRKQKGVIVGEGDER